MLFIDGAQHKHVIMKPGSEGWVSKRMPRSMSIKEIYPGDTTLLRFEKATIKALISFFHSKSNGSRASLHLQLLCLFQYAD